MSKTLCNTAKMLALGFFILTTAGCLSAFSPKKHSAEITIVTNAAEMQQKKIQEKQERKIELTGLLTDESETIRARAAFEMGEIDPADETLARTLVLRIVEETSPLVLQNIGLALSKHKKIPYEEIGAVINLLKNADWLMRWYGAKALGNMGAKADVSVAALVKALSDEIPWVRANAAEALGKIGTGATSTVPDLVKTLSDKKRIVRERAKEALAEIGPGVLEEVEKLFYVPSQDWRTVARGFWVLRKIREPAIPTFVRVLTNAEDAAIRRAAAKSLNTKDPDLLIITVPALTRAVDDEDADVRYAAIQTLGVIGEPALSALPIILHAKTDENSRVGAVAAKISQRLVRIRMQKNKVDVIRLLKQE